MDVEWLEQKHIHIYKDVGVYELLYNILCVYYYRMIKLQHGHPQPPKAGRETTHINQKPNNTLYL